MAGQGWGTVCDSGWDSWQGEINSEVVCKQLGLPWQAAYPAPYGRFGANYGMPIVMDGVKCSGWEADMQSCSRTSNGNSNCQQHSQDVGEAYIMQFPKLNMQACMLSGCWIQFGIHSVQVLYVSRPDHLLRLLRLHLQCKVHPMKQLQYTSI